MPCPVFDCKFKADSRSDGKTMQTKAEQELDLKQQEEALKAHYQSVHSDLVNLGLGLCHDQHGRLACEMKDSMLNQLIVFTLANKQQVSKFQIDEEEREVRELKRKIHETFNERKKDREIKTE